MSFPIEIVRTVEDYNVDRLEVEAYRYVELTSTNSSRI